MNSGVPVKPTSNEPVLLKNVQIRWRNFEGRGSAYNAEGKRNFVIELDEPTAVELYEGGWNVKLSKPSDEGTQSAFLPVEANYAGRTPPEVWFVGTKNRTVIPEEMLAMADGVEIDHCHVYIRPYDWKMARGSGRKAYLKTIAIVVAHNPIHDMYEHLEETSATEQPALESGDQTPPDISYDGELPVLEPYYPDVEIIED
jgi:hypothetical protein